MAKEHSEDYAGIKILAKDHLDYQVFSNKSSEDVLFTNFAYEKDKKSLQQIADSVDASYQLLMISDHIQGTSDFSYSCAVFINYENKEIVFANAGTRPALSMFGLHDLIDDALLVLQKQPFKMNQAAELNRIVLNSLGSEAKNFKFHYTGHSLGAAIAELAAADMDIKLRNRELKRSNSTQITAITFENPGTKPIIDKIYADAGYDFDSKKDVRFCEFNNRSNVINNLNTHTSEVYRVLPNNQNARVPSTFELIFEVISNYCSKINPLLSKIFSLLAPGGIGAELLSDHSLNSFDTIFVQKEGIVRDKSGDVITLGEALTGIKHIKFDQQIADNLSDIKKVNGDIGKQSYMMKKYNEEKGKFDEIRFSFEELKNASPQEPSLKRIPSAQNKKSTNTYSNPEQPRLHTAKEVIATSALMR